jgi:CheY-like chemotaxis protein
MRVFVVEDDPDQRALSRDALESAGWTVEVAEDGIAALGRITRAVPDAIVLDLRMPNLDGVAVLELLRSTERGSEIPVIVTTGADVTDRVRKLASLVLQKPFTAPELLRALHSVRSW